MGAMIKYRVRLEKDKRIIAYETMQGGLWRHCLIGEEQECDGTLNFVSYLVFLSDDPLRESKSALIREQFSGFLDADKKEIYIGDTISAETDENCNMRYSGTVVFHAGYISMQIKHLEGSNRNISTAYNIDSIPPLYDLSNLLVA